MGLFPQIGALACLVAFSAALQPPLRARTPLALPSLATRRYLQPQPACTLTPRVACHVGVWDVPPTHMPSSGVVDGPLLGNGDLGAGLAAGTSGGAGVWYFGKSDMWATNTGVDAVDPDLHSDTFYTAIGAGRLTVAPSGTPLAGPTGFTARQDLASASVAANLSAPSGELNVTFESAIVASDENTFMSVLRFSSSTAAPVLFDLTIAQTTVWGLPLSAGVFGGKSSPPPSPLLSWAAWAAKEGVTSTDNSLTLMPCDTRTFVIAPSTNVW